MSLKKTLGVVAFGSAVALALNGVGCGGGGSGGATGGTSGSAGGTSGSGTTGNSGTSGSGAGGTSGAATGGSKGTSTGGSKGTGAGGTSGTLGFDSGSDSGSMCTAASLTGFTGGLNPSANSAGGCSTAIITQIVDECFGGNPDAGASDCTALLGGAAAKKCIDGCIQTPWTSDTGSTLTWKSTPWGALWYMTWGTMTPYGIFNGVNLGGCYAAAEPTNAKAKACATDLEENVECFMQACASNCPIPCNPMGDPTCKTTMAEYTAASDAFSGCIGSVDPSSGSGACTASSTKANTDCASLETVDSGPVGECNSAYTTLYTAGLTNAQYTTALTQLFDVICGPASSGGGG